MDKALAAKLLALKERIEPHFSTSDWSDVGFLTGHFETIDSHPRLFRAMRFGDEDYGACIASVLQSIHSTDPGAIQTIKEFVDRKYPDGSAEYISALPSERTISFAPQVFKVPTCPLEDDLVSVMMPFDGRFGAVYEAIKGGVEHNFMRCLRADNVWNHSTIIQDIFELIFKARIVVIDFTSKNPNVNYEAGIAHTLGKEVIPLSQSMDDIPFDIRHHRVLTYLNNGEGLKKLTRELSAKIDSIIMPKAS